MRTIVIETDEMTLGQALEELAAVLVAQEVKLPVHARLQAAHGVIVDALQDAQAEIARLTAENTALRAAIVHGEGEGETG